MAGNERYDIEVTDKVDGSIPTKLRDIATAATAGHNAVSKLKADLAAINDTPVRKLAAASASMSNALARELNAQAKLTSARSAAAVADAKAATEAQRLATEVARTEAATQRAAAAAARAGAAQLAQEAAALRLQATQARLAQSAGQAAAGEDRLASEVDQARAAFERGEINIRKYVQALQQAGATAPNVGKGINDVANNADNAAKKYQNAGTKIRSQNANIIAQLQDIGVSLAGGQNPFLVLIQQGSQLSYIASTMDGGFKALTITIAKMLVPFLPLVAAVGALYLGFRNFTNDMATKHKPELEKYANSLGLTSKEMNKLEGATVSASGKLKEHDQITITAADSWNGFIATVKQGLAGFSEEWNATTNFLKTAWNATTNFLYYAFAGFYGAVVGGIRALIKIIMNLPQVAGNTAKAIANVTIAAVEWMINKAIDGINGLTDWAEPLLEKFGLSVGNIGHVSFGRFAQEGQSAFGIIGDEVNGAIHEFARTTSAFKQIWDKNTLDAAKKRIKGIADAMKDARTPPKAKKEADPKSQADYIEDTNKALDNELARMKMLKDAREEQARLDQIEQEFLRRRMPLDQAQLKAFADKIHAIQEFKYQQAEMDRIVEEADAPLRTYNAAIAASNDLLARHVISQQQASQEQVKASRAYQEATDPLFAMKEAMTQAEGAATKYGVAAQQAAYYEQIRQAYLAKGIILGQNSTAAINAEVAALMKRNAALIQQQTIQSTIGGIVDPIMQDQQMLQNKAAYYSELNRMADEYNLNEASRAQALAQLDAKFNEIRLKQANDFFGTLAGLASSSNSTLAAIGKAAAISQATINMYVAASEALKLPFPANLPAIAQTIAAGASLISAIQGTSTNVGSYKNGGSFMVDGKAGVDANNINMNVTKGERVTVETKAQQRAASGNGQPVVNANTKIINQFDEREFVAAMDSDEGERIILNVIKRNPNAIKSAGGQ